MIKLEITLVNGDAIKICSSSKSSIDTVIDDLLHKSTVKLSTRAGEMYYVITDKIASIRKAEE